MVEEVISIISDIDNQCSKDSDFSDANRERVGMYMDILKETMTNQHTIIESYELITKKLESQIAECQAALDDSTKREMDQLELIVKLKEQHDALRDDDDSDYCEECEAYEQENEVLREQVEQQGLVIEKLSKAQELLMGQYKQMEGGLNRELEEIKRTQAQIEEMQGIVKEAGEIGEGEEDSNDKEEEMEPGEKKGEE